MHELDSVVIAINSTWFDQITVLWKINNSSDNKVMTAVYVWWALVEYYIILMFFFI